MMNDDPWLLLCGLAALYYGKYKHLEKSSQELFGDTARIYFESFTLMLTIFSVYSSHKCYVSSKGQVLFLITLCISILHEKLLFKWTAAQGTEKIIWEYKVTIRFSFPYFTFVCGKALCKSHLLLQSERWSIVVLSVKNAHTVKLPWLIPLVNYFCFSFPLL